MIATVRRDPTQATLQARRDVWVRLARRLPRPPPRPRRVIVTPEMLAGQAVATMLASAERGGNPVLRLTLPDEQVRVVLDQMEGG